MTMNLENLREFLLRNKTYIIIGLLLMNLFLAITSTYNDSLTWDEKCYAGLGRYFIETWNHKVSGLVHHPPLSYYMNSLFLFFIDISDYVWKFDDCWEIGNSIIFHSGYDPQFLVFLIRLPFILLSLLLGFYVYKWAMELYGIKAGLFALFIYSLSPSIMSTSRLALTDFPVVTFIFISIYYFWRLTRDHTSKNIIKAGIYTGLALTSKATGIYLLPLFFILSLFQLNKKNVKIKIISFLTIFLIASLIVFIMYGFQFQTVESSLPEHYKERAYQEVNKKFPNNGMTKDIVLYLFQRVPLPATNYISGFGTVAFYSTTGFKTYLLGEIYEAGNKPWYYFFVVMLVKTALPILILLVISIYFFKKIRSKKAIDELFLALPIIFLFIPFMFNQISVDLRHILTIYPFIFVFISKCVNLKFKNQKLWNIFWGFLLLWYFISTITIYPYYTSYFNELVLPKNGYKVLLGANIDAGQDLIRLKNYLDKNNIQKINLSLHGGVEPKNYGIVYDYMPTTCFAPINKDFKPYAENCKEDFTEDCSKRKGIVAISVTNLQNRFLKNSTCFNWLNEYEPITMLGYSIFVYNITK